MEDKDNLIWYVCYGSNMHLNRFMCYLTGEAYPKYRLKKGSRCNNVNPPKESWRVKIPYKLYFGYNSSNWDNQGVAFLDPIKINDGVTIGRAYLISKEQFEHIKNREGKAYNHIIRLDDIDFIPAYTFTSDVKFKDNKPSNDYLKCIKEGLKELKLTPSEIVDYLKDLI